LTKFYTSLYLDNHKNRIKFQGHTQTSRSHSFWGVFCQHDTAATRGQYLAFSEA